MKIPKSFRCFPLDPLGFARPSCLPQTFCPATVLYFESSLNNTVILNQKTFFSVGFSCKGKQGFYANPKDCGAFIRCVYGRPFHFKCPEGLKFNVKESSCDWPRNVKCGGKYRAMQIVSLPYYAPRNIMHYNCKTS